MNKKSAPLIILAILAIIVAIVVFRSSVTVNGGEAGVLFRPFGGGIVTDEPPLGEGFHIIAPWNSVEKYEVRTKEEKLDMKVLSKNGLDIDVEVSIQFKPATLKLGMLHQEVGNDYLNRIVIPRVKSATREVIGKYNPEELYSSKRDLIQKEIESQSKTELGKRYIVLENILIRNIGLPNSIKAAIENKLKQEQASKEYEFRITKEEKEAERKRIEAKGIKDFQDIVSEGISEKLLRWKGIEATLDLAKSQNSKVIVIGSGNDGLPLILNGQ